ncbi:hypothetical protein BDP27DRAFT_805413 [Rhodocollybia butyracea]|uniref:Uncharacterized protein n=1 Tax=Rhodocollybia butyracea TaxID=206335 RepID=A0A9P5Q8H0_9AGAR|nr:hypothetical protein BDP27DRAFT_805413 [Rhodocollybia butyracea]
MSINSITEISSPTIGTKLHVQIPSTGPSRDTHSTSHIPAPTQRPHPSTHQNQNQQLQQQIIHRDPGPRNSSHNTVNQPIFGPLPQTSRNNLLPPPTSSPAVLVGPGKPGASTSFSGTIPLQSRSVQQSRRGSAPTLYPHVASPSSASASPVFLHRLPNTGPTSSVGLGHPTQNLAISSTHPHVSPRQAPNHPPQSAVSSSPPQPHASTSTPTQSATVSHSTPFQHATASLLSSAQRALEQTWNTLLQSAEKEISGLHDVHTSQIRVWAEYAESFKREADKLKLELREREARAERYKREVEQLRQRQQRIPDQRSEQIQLELIAQLQKELSAAKGERDALIQIQKGGRLGGDGPSSPSGPATTDNSSQIMLQLQAQNHLVDRLRKERNDLRRQVANMLLSPPQNTQSGPLQSSQQGLLQEPPDPGLSSLRSENLQLARDFASLQAAHSNLLNTVGDNSLIVSQENTQSLANHNPMYSRLQRDFDDLLEKEEKARIKLNIAEDALKVERERAFEVDEKRKKEKIARKEAEREVGELRERIGSLERQLENRLKEEGGSGIMERQVDPEAREAVERRGDVIGVDGETEEVSKTHAIPLQSDPELRSPLKSPAGRSRSPRHSRNNIARNSPIDVDADTDIPDHAQDVTQGLPPPTPPLTGLSASSPQPQPPTSMFTTIQSHEDTHFAQHIRRRSRSASLPNDAPCYRPGSGYSNCQSSQPASRVASPTPASRPSSMQDSRPSVPPFRDSPPAPISHNEIVPPEGTPSPQSPFTDNDLLLRGSMRRYQKSYAPLQDGMSSPTSDAPPFRDRIPSRPPSTSPSRPSSSGVGIIPPGARRKSASPLPRLNMNVLVNNKLIQRSPSSFSPNPYLSKTNNHRLNRSQSPSSPIDAHRIDDREKGEEEDETSKNRDREKVKEKFVEEGEVGEISGDVMLEHGTPRHQVPVSALRPGLEFSSMSVTAPTDRISSPSVFTTVAYRDYGDSRPPSRLHERRDSNREPSSAELRSSPLPLQSSGGAVPNGHGEHFANNLKRKSIHDAYVQQSRAQDRERSHSHHDAPLQSRSQNREYELERAYSHPHKLAKMVRDDGHVVAVAYPGDRMEFNRHRDNSYPPYAKPYSNGSGSHYLPSSLPSPPPPQSAVPMSISPVTPASPAFSKASHPSLPPRPKVEQNTSYNHGHSMNRSEATRRNSSDSPSVSPAYVTSPLSSSSGNSGRSHGHQPPPAPNPSNSNKHMFTTFASHSGSAPHPVQPYSSFPMQHSIQNPHPSTQLPIPEAVRSVDGWKKTGPWSSQSQSGANGTGKAWATAPGGGGSQDQSKNSTTPTPAPVKQLSFKHVELLYDTVGGEYVCRECRLSSTSRMTKPQSFPTTSRSFTEIFAHYSEQHKEKEEEVLKWSPVKLQEQLVLLKRGGPHGSIGNGTGGGGGRKSGKKGTK